MTAARRGRLAPPLQGRGGHIGPLGERALPGEAASAPLPRGGRDGARPSQCAAKMAAFHAVATSCALPAVVVAKERDPPVRLFSVAR